MSYSLNFQILLYPSVSHLISPFHLFNLTKALRFEKAGSDEHVVECYLFNH